VNLEIPLVPPSVNHYKTRFRGGNTVVSDEALAFKAAVATYARGNCARGKEFSVIMQITLGKGDRGDVDNFPKLVLDGLAECGAFRDHKDKRLSDAHVNVMQVTVDRKTRPERGSTTITVIGI
jgi:Holliday junction resolvase RusA-like endonuclease